MNMTETQSLPQDAASEGEKQQSHDIVAVHHWDSSIYAGQEVAGTIPANFLMEVTDRREGCGQYFVDVAAEDGDDIMSASFEIGNLPESRTQCQVLHLHADNEELILSVYKQGDAYILRPEVGVSILPTKLPNGERGYVLR
jgi:hypothetical protein